MTIVPGVFALHVLLSVVFYSNGPNYPGIHPHDVQLYSGRNAEARCVRNAGEFNTIFTGISPSFSVKLATCLPATVEDLR